MAEDAIMLRAKYVRLERASGAGVAARWKSQYCRDGVWEETTSGSSEQTYAALVALGDAPALSEVDRIIGNLSWAHLWCEGCHEYVDILVLIGEEYSESKGYCGTCITEADWLIRNGGGS